MNDNKASTQTADDMVADIDTGGRQPEGLIARFFLAVAFIWSLFHLYIASNLPFILTETLDFSFVVTSTDARRIHLAFAIFLACLAFPLFKTSPRKYIPWYDWLFGVFGIVACIYAIVFADAIAVRAGLPTLADRVISGVGMVLLGVTIFRSLGLPLLIISSIFVAYVVFWSCQLAARCGAVEGGVLWQGDLALLDAG